MEGISLTDLKKLHKHMREINDMEKQYEETVVSLENAYAGFVDNLKTYKEYEASKQQRLRTDYEKISRKHRKILALYQQYNALKGNQAKSLHNFSEFEEFNEDRSRL